jgi:hypothetical protein
MFCPQVQVSEEYVLDFQQTEYESENDADKSEQEVFVFSSARNDLFPAYSGYDIDNDLIDRREPEA